MVFKQYGDEWCEERRLLSRYFQPNTVPQYRAVQQREARRFLNVLLRDQNDLDGSLKLLVDIDLPPLTFRADSEQVAVQDFDYDCIRNPLRGSWRAFRSYSE